MGSLNVLGVSATGGLGILVAGLIVSKMYDLNLDGILGLALLLFVGAGAISLIAKSR